MLQNRKAHINKAHYHYPYRDTAGVLLTLAACLLLLWDPQNAIEGGLQGLRIFGEIVLPSLLPFFVVAELLIGLGVVHFIGALVEPLMRPLFNVPGTGSFVWSMGLAAGYPMDAVITAKLRNAGDCTRVEGERLLAFTNTADPLFLLGAVAVGMFGLPALGFHIAAAHYISAILVGLIFRFHGRSETALPRGHRERQELQSRHRQEPVEQAPSGYLAYAFYELRRARRQDGRDFGRLLADAMADSTATLLKICGFIMFFASLIQLMNTTGMMAALGWPVRFLLKGLGWEPDLTPGLLAGVLELDVGAAMTAGISAPLVQRLAVVSAIVAWSGLSVHGQVASIVATTDLRLGAYIKARLLHAALAAGLAMLLFYVKPPFASAALTTATGAVITATFFPYFRYILAMAFTGVGVLGGAVCYLAGKRKAG